MQIEGEDLSRVNTGGRATTRFQEGFLEGSRDCFWAAVDGGERDGGEPGIHASLMPLSTGQTNTVPPKKRDAPCLL